MELFDLAELGEDIEACPFCGSRAELKMTSTRVPSLDGIAIKGRVFHGVAKFHVSCFYCCVDGPGLFNAAHSKTPEELMTLAIEKWNFRKAEGG